MPKTIQTMDDVRSITGDFKDDVDHNGNYALGLQNIQDLAAKGPGFWFDGVDDVITIADSANLDFNTGDGTIQVFVNMADVSTSNYIYARYVDISNRFALSYVHSTNTLNGVFDVGGALNRVNGDWEPSADTWYNIVWVIKNGVSNALYVNGKALSLTVDTPTAGDMSLTADLRIGAYSGLYSKQTIKQYNQFNLALTKAEALAISSGAPMPYKYIGASQDDMVTDGDMSNAGSWGGAAVVAGGVATFNGALPHLTQDIGVILGKTYRVNYEVISGTLGGDLALSTAGFTDSIPIDKTIGAHSVEVVATSFDNLDFITVTATDFVLDNISVTQIGCVLQLEQPGIGHSQWLDNSGNELHGAVTGALPTNLPADDIERFRHTVAITGDTAWVDVVPAGYAADMLILKNTGTGACLLDLGSTSGAHDVFQNQAVAGKGGDDYSLTNIIINKLFSETVAQSLYLNDDSTPGWTNVSLTATLLMKRVI